MGERRRVGYGVNITSHGPTHCVRVYIKNKLFLEEVDSLSQRGILTLNNFYVGKAIWGGERMCDGKLRNTTPKYLNTLTQSWAIKTQKLIIQEQSCKN